MPLPTLTVLQQFIDLYQVLDKHNLGRLGEVYSPEIHFQDPLHEVQGLSAFQQYFANLYANLNSCQFKIIEACPTVSDLNKQNEQSHEAQQALVIWQMQFSHPRLQNGQLISVDGASHLRFKDKIYYHRDYADMGQMLYEHIPVLGSAVRYIKRRTTT